MRELGYVEGRDFVLEIRMAEGRQELVPALAAELVGVPVDVVVAQGTVPTSAARAATSTTPIVMVNAEDPLGSGFVASLAHPGGNITGMSSMAVELNGKRMELLKQIAPGITRVAVIWNPGIPERAFEFPGTEAAARALGLQVVPLEAREARALQASFEMAVRQRADAVLTLDNLVITNNRAQVIDLAMMSRLPMITQRPELAREGGLMSYGPDTVDQRRRAAVYVDKIIKGASPSELPVELPTKFELIVNLKTALGLTIPPSILQQATEFIQ